MTALRVWKVEIPSELGESMIKPFGAVAEPVEVTWHNPLESGPRWQSLTSCWDYSCDFDTSFNLLVGAADRDPVSGTASHRGYLCEIRPAK